MPRFCSVWRQLRFLILALFAGGLCDSAVPPVALAQLRVRDRVLEPIDGTRLSVSRGNVHPSARPEYDRGAVDPAMRLHRVTMLFSQTPEQQADLQALLGDLQDRSSPDHHRWLTPEAFAERFGSSRSDVDKIVSWLQAQGLTIEQVSRSRTWVAFSGTARQVESALRTEIRRYAVRGETHYANRRDPLMPSAFASVVLGFRGLHDFRLKPRRIKKVSVRPRFTSEISQNHFLAPDDFATIYNLKPLYSMGINGTGQKIAVVGQSAIQLSDIQTFRSLSGLPASTPQVILVPQSVTGDADPGMVEGDVDEASLDVEWAGAVARNAAILYVYSENVLDAFFHVIDENLAPILSISYGACEDEDGVDGFTSTDADIFASIAQQANTQGITIISPSGDTGAADCDNGDSLADEGLAVDLPASLPYATAVGGTRFNEGAGAYWSATNNSSNGSALSYIPEIAWNDTAPGGPFAATGGGSSIFFSKPSWQTGNGVPNGNQRHVPDVSFNASADHDGHLVCSQDNSSGSFQPTCVIGFRDSMGGLTVFGGTSVGVPTFAGIVALLNQQTNSPQGQGNINYILYPLAANFPAAFHDTTSGDNRVPCDQGDPLALPPRPASPDCPTSGPDAGFIGFDAGPGYDRVTGLGSVNAFSLVTAWTSVSSTPASKGSTAPDFQLALSPPNLTVSRGGSGTAQLTVAAINGFVGSVNIACSVPVALAGVTCSVTSGAGTGTRTVTVSAAVGGSIQGRRTPVGPGTWFGMFGAGLLLVTWSMWAASRSSIRPPKLAPALILGCLLALAIGCKSGGNGTPLPSGSGAVTLQGTSGNINHLVQLAVTVQ